VAEGDVCALARPLVGSLAWHLLSPRPCCSPGDGAGAGGGRDAAGRISGVNMRLRGVVLRAISASQRCLHQKKALHSQHQRGLYRGERGNGCFL